ncbi:MAG: hypothetical protein ACI9CP_001674 [Cryomorphaceae bacterium]|jgi:hypothetical protein
MKSQILIFSTLIIAAGLAAFGITKDRDLTEPIADNPCKVEFTPRTPIADIFKPNVLTDFFYDFGPRFNPITKQELSEARSVSDFVDQKEIARMDGVRSMTVIVIENDNQTNQRILGKGEKLSNDQLKLIQSFDYSSHFLIRAEFRSNRQVELREENIYRPHMTVVPEKQAAYEGGKEALLSYMRESNQKNTCNLDERKLQPAKLSFTVTKNGMLEQVSLDRTSGYMAIDESMIKLANNLPGKWQPAENAKGEKVDQVLVLSFGMVGC